MVLLNLDEAIDIAQKTKGPRGGAPKIHLLLGNGFSIALKPDIFTYNSLYSKANFSDFPSVQRAFEQLETKDFEQVVFSLEQAAQILPCYAPEHAEIQKQIRTDAQHLKEILIQTIAGNHPDLPTSITDDKYTSCIHFLKPFLEYGKIYTLNYDILLYWTLMNGKEKGSIKFDDGFRSDPDDEYADYVIWDNGDSNTQNVHYLHGALHLFDSGHQLRKYTWNRTKIPLVDQARKAISDNAFPLFVSEGSSSKKMGKIVHNGYLHKALRSFTGIRHSLFIHGLSLSPNDEHILQRIEKGKLTNVFVGIHGDHETETNRQTITRAEQMATNRGDGSLQIFFYNSDTANVWG